MLVGRSQIETAAEAEPALRINRVRQRSEAAAARWSSAQIRFDMVRIYALDSAQIPPIALHHERRPGGLRPGAALPQDYA